MAILRIARLWPSSQQSGKVTVHAAAAAAHRTDGLDAFGSESAPALDAAPKPPKSPSSKSSGNALPAWVGNAGKWAAVVVLTAVTAVAGVIGYQHRFGLKPATGSVTVDTTPTGLDVVIAGKTVGKTPVTLALAPGAYDVRLGAAETGRTIKVNVVAGASVVQHVEMPAAADTAAISVGALRIQTEPSKLPVLVDGVERGVSPLTVEGIEAGDHDVTVKSDRGVLRRTVKVEPRATVSLIISSAIAPADTGAVAAGWLSISASVPLQLREDGKIIGSTETDRLMLPAGDHDLDLVNESLGFRTQRKVHVNAGKTTSTRIDLPTGTMSLNASPWAEVFVDGERVGETPIGNLSRPIGRHEVIFRHPELGERRETVVVTVQGTARLGVDLRKK